MRGGLRGESAPRIAFLRGVVEKTTKTGFNEPAVAYYLNATDAAGTILYYFDYHRPARYDFPLPTTINFSATLIDPYNMTMTPVQGTFSGKSRIALPNKPFQAILFQKVSDNHKGAEAAKPEVMD